MQVQHIKNVKIKTQIIWKVLNLFIRRITSVKNIRLPNTNIAADVHFETVMQQFVAQKGKEKKLFSEVEIPSTLFSQSKMADAF